MKGRKRWLIALLAALAAAIPALAPELAPLVPAIERQSGQDAALPPVDLDPRQCASNWSECPPTPSADLHSQRR